MEIDDRDSKEVPQGPRSTLGGFWGLLSPAEQADLWSLGRVRAFRPGEAVCVEGAATTEVLVLTEGWVKVLTEKGQRRTVVLALRGRGDIVGELAGHGDGHRTAGVEAASEVQALVINYDVFSQFTYSSPVAGRAFSDVMTSRWSEAAGILSSRALESAPTRLAGFLLDLGRRSGNPSGQAVVIKITLSQEEMANLIGASRVSVARALQSWRSRGLVSTARHQITIIDCQGLRSAASRDDHEAGPDSRG